MQKRGKTITIPPSITRPFFPQVLLCSRNISFIPVKKSNDSTIINYFFSIVNNGGIF